MERHKESEESFNLEVDSRTELPLSEREDKVSQSLEKAQDLRKQGEYDKGIEELLDALKLEAKKDEVYYRLGNIYYDAGDLDRAEYAYNRAIEKNDKHVNAQHNLAVVYKDQGKVSKSVKQRKKANKLELKNPKNPDLSEEERSFAKRFALKLGLLILGGLGLLALVIYLVAVFVL